MRSKTWLNFYCDPLTFAHQTCSSGIVSKNISAPSYVYLHKYDFYFIGSALLRTSLIEYAWSKNQHENVKILVKHGFTDLSGLINYGQIANKASINIFKLICKSSQYTKRCLQNQILKEKYPNLHKELNNPLRLNELCRISLRDNGYADKGCEFLPKNFKSFLYFEVNEF